MKRFTIILAMFVMLLFAFSLTLAQDSVDDEGNLNNPRTNPRANACYDGAELGGKCDTSDLDEDGTVEAWEKDLMWDCGWHYIRWQYGLVSREDFAPQCVWLLPPPPVEIPAPTQTPTQAPILD
ncbi:MAG: hypothetical protein Q9P44_19715 [Anaerolineae bacterium]|nr:hypothetical protein [Anaerolineae bacterium]